jgi:branched-chain amino acid transport system ATP-binding protein
MLEVQGLSKRFGGLVAVNDLSFEVPRNSILGMIGINGAGKTTVMNCINGLYTSDAGRITLGGADISRKTPHDIAHQGLGRTFQVPRVFHRMTLVENLLSTVLDSKLSDAELIETAESILDSVDLYGLRHNHGEELSGGQQKLLELARVMMFDPDMILLDEPFAGVNPSLCRLLIERIEALLGAGKTFLLVSHDLTSIYRLSSRILVLNQGQRIAEGGVEDIKNDPQVIEAYLGN